MEYEADLNNSSKEGTMTALFRGTSVLTCAMMAVVWSGGHSALAAGGDAAKGKSIFQSKCVTCHGPQGKGDGPLGPKLKPPAGDFTSAEAKQKSADELRHIIENGVPKTSMVAWKTQLSEKEIDDVLAYVESLRK
jgi:mono/diheme cytochrome c family protein